VELGEYGLGELGEFMPLWCFLQHTCRASLLRMVGMIGETPPEISLWPNRSINLVVFFIYYYYQSTFFTVVEYDSEYIQNGLLWRVSTFGTRSKLHI
jgi:hypothetical protein